MLNVLFNVDNDCRTEIAVDNLSMQPSKLRLIFLERIKIFSQITLPIETNWYTREQKLYFGKYFFHIPDKSDANLWKVL